MDEATERIVRQVAWDAASAFVLRPCVFLLLGCRADELPQYIGSGTLLSTPGGRHVVLTAQHNLEGYPGKPLSLGGSPEGSLAHDGLVETAICHPDGADVALLVLRRALPDDLPELAAPASLVALLEDATIEEAQYVAAGYPAAYSGRRHDRLTHLVVSHRPIVLNIAPPVVHRSGRYEFSWRGKADDDQQAELPEPPGVSGGAVWRFHPTDGNEPWSSQRNALLVGVLESWKEGARLQYAEAASKWGAWFREAVRRIDEG